MTGADSEEEMTAGRTAAALSRRGPRWLISVRVLVVLLALSCAVVLVLWAVQWRSVAAAQELAGQAVTVRVPAPGGASQSDGTSQTGGASAGAPPAGKGEPTATGPPVVVHVAGAVHQPGVVTLPAGSRVIAAIAAAGGAAPTAQVSALNLAALATDGMKIVVPTQEQVAAGFVDTSQQGTPGGGPAAPTGAAAGAPAALNLNTATAADLEALPGVGPVLAARVVAWRLDHGAFSSVEQLEAVPGIGGKLLAALRPLLRAP